VKFTAWQSNVFAQFMQMIIIINNKLFLMAFYGLKCIWFLLKETETGSTIGMRKEWTWEGKYRKISPHFCFFS